MILSDRDIKSRLAAGSLIIEPLADLDLQVQPASVDLRLSPTFVVYRLQRLVCLDARNPHSVEGLTDTIVIPDGEAFVLQPGAFALGSTVERVVIPDDLVARVEGRSSIGRLGVVVHATAGFIDPGFNGQITLEFSNLGQCPVKLYPGMRISQIVYQTMTSPAERPYGSKSRQSKYQGQRGPLASRIGHDAQTTDAQTSDES